MDGPGHTSGTSLKPVDAAVESSQNPGPKGVHDTSPWKLQSFQRMKRS